MGNIHGHGPNCHDVRIPKNTVSHSEPKNGSDATERKLLVKFSGVLSGDQIIPRDIQRVIFHMLLGGQHYEEPGKFSEKNWKAIADWVNCQKVCKAWNESCWDSIPKDFATRVLQRVCRISANKWTEHLNVANKLLKYGADPSADDCYALQVAAERGHAAIVETLLNKEGVDPSVNDHHAIFHAAKYGHEKVVEVLLKDTDDEYVKNTRMLDAALTHDKWEVIYVLMRDPRTDITYGNHKVIIKACDCRWFGSDNLHVLLKDGRLDPGAQDNACLKIAAENNNERIVKMLLADPRVDPYAHRNFIIKGLGKGSSAIVKLIKEATSPKQQH
eukprot:TRINITY_DN5592_c0_g2_i2.p1 TRINITY_DN5592_c0_g2~~TRINITY_DN5592_c0_g2_i2.p1  ORF type:complete len:330 (+),score=55.27 TRINITY_DN5592_c0_g2_i2:34-1023(+)